ncbi:hypothetical protein EAS64_27555 [Trebonia kvetii]|uniref:Uncharacterized protein n=1 Tax=Trebonia kvetii TaxID=2480626 RepID=A0A6P2BTW0_9ACTN|nr:hypothetical protein [Trebonia kvetii]TVZ02539.1 hypothetical protein EAS64_27555 [Trebonia kvetii]
MNEATLERRYRWLLRWYPSSFRNDTEDELLGVLMTNARDGQRWPSAAEAADMLRGALVMRFRLPRPGAESRSWTDAWAVFSVLAPVFVLLTNLVVVLVTPSFLRWHVKLPGYLELMPIQARWLGTYDYAPYSGAHPFYTALICEAVLVILVLGGWRLASLAFLVVSAVLWAQSQYTFPPPVTLINAGAGILELGALMVSPGPRRGRSMLNWGHGVVLVLVIAAVKLSSVTFWAVSLPAHSRSSTMSQLVWVVLLSAGALVVIAGAAAMRLRLGRYTLWIGGALLYPYVLEFAATVFGGRSYGNLLLDVTPLHMVILFLGPAVMVALAALIAVRGRLVSSAARLTPGS